MLTRDFGVQTGNFLQAGISFLFESDVKARRQVVHYNAPQSPDDRSIKEPDDNSFSSMSLLFPVLSMRVHPPILNATTPFHISVFFFFYIHLLLPLPSGNFGGMDSSVASQADVAGSVLSRGIKC